MKTALVLGAGGFIGHHMVKRLKQDGYWVRGVDLKYPEFSKTEADEFIIADLRNPLATSGVMFSPDQDTVSTNGFDEVYQFAADMGGAGYIFSGEHDADVMHNSASINLNVAYYAKYFHVKKVFFSSSACMYPQELQNNRNSTLECFIGLAESDAYPANPDSEYGWEKLFSERLYLAYARNYGLNVRIARFHNIYGPEGTYKGGKEKAPAAMLRKAVEATNSMEIWGDGEQTRSFLFINDCIGAVRALMESDFKEPINIGSEEMVSINHLADIAIGLTGKDVVKLHLMNKPQGVRGRNSDNTLIRKVLGWEPQWTLQEGMTETYAWIKKQME